ncbi:MAG: DUF3179 domain-containing protein [Hyphomicrobiaceae bacterium]|nr:DUF3179 domain-containing protein [Hyphomicrobiaceae bacterium]
MRAHRNSAGRILTLIFTLCAITLIAAHNAHANPERWKRQGWSKTDFDNKSIDYSEILSGGPPKDGIPSIDNPKFVSVSEIKSFKGSEPVIGLDINGDARAYPLQILIWHEIVNDTVGGTPVSVTYCPLCNSAVVFDRRLGDKVLDFGTTGKLRNSDLVMYDRQTESWWQQFTGTGIVGELTGKELKTIPARLESFDNFKTRHPDGKVLIPNNKDMRAYGRNPYVGYDSATKPFLYNGDLPKDINPMARVVVFKVDGKPNALTLKLLREKGEVKVGDISLKWQKGQNSALDASQIADGRDVGNVTAQRKTASGSEDVVYDVTFAFVFHAFHPKRPIIKS